jgi:hypothetical protein
MMPERIAQAWRRLRRGLRTAVLDLRSGRLMTRIRPSRYAGAGAQQTQSSPYEALEALFTRVPIGPDDVLVDVGCGDGRVIHWWLLRGLRNRIIGLEIDPDVAAATARAFRRHPNVEVRPSDAIASLPPEGTIWYLGNPFGPGALARFRDALEAARGEAGATVVFYNLNHHDLFAPPWRLEEVPSPIYGRLAVIRLEPRQPA